MQGKISLWVIFISLIFAFMISCSNDDGPKGNCFQDEDREIVAMFTNATGEVVGPSDNLCPDLFILTGGPEHPKRFAMHLLPCNLPDNLKEDGLKVIFSGYLYETFDLEDVCAQKFEITDIKLE